MISALNAFGDDAHMCLRRMGDDASQYASCVSRSDDAFNALDDALPL